MLHEFADARSKDKAITEEISEQLITTFVTPMEREDIEALAESLYKIPKTVEKFAERYRIVADQAEGRRLQPQVATDGTGRRSGAADGTGAARRAGFRQHQDASEPAPGGRIRGRRRAARTDAADSTSPAFPR